jgi:hypothetical protein
MIGTSLLKASRKTDLKLEIQIPDNHQDIFEYLSLSGISFFISEK